ncbi:hypothetical protein C1645_834239 [Glomus cerebriforme]|uniref:Uncharacterized protein n=1 Tax=Glomus cerebriforme TaxID=658196 RepID=A0A397SEL3_9GLOM|nr:hypothetical protein C1645_834239 [Glomus cerebriforme]
MSSSTEWSDAQLRLLINERKQRNFEYHATPNKKKQDFCDDIASKLNEQENTNFFLGKDCQKKFLSLTKAFNTAKRYREELSFDQQHNESVRRKSGTSLSSSPKQPERFPGESSSQKVVKNFKETPVTPSTVEPLISTFGASSRPDTPTLPSFSQNANVINVTINNNYTGAPEEG